MPKPSRASRRAARYVLLGQYLDENADAIAAALDAAQVPYYTTRASAITQSLFMGEWGVRIFVQYGDRDRAGALAATVADT
jgi:hypothetical protein